MLILLCGTGIYVAAAYADIRTRRIPNELVLGILVLAALRLAFSRDPTAALYTLVASATLFVATFLLFWRGLLGGGDVKLLVATAFLIGYHNIVGCLLVMSICGALVAIAMLAGEKFGWRRMAIPIQEHDEKPARLTVPYGVPIAVAGVTTLVLQYLQPG